MLWDQSATGWIPMVSDFSSLKENWSVIERIFMQNRLSS